MSAPASSPPTLLRYIWDHTRPQQIWVLLIVVASLPTYFMSFDLPKQIVNGPIQGRGFEQPGATEHFLRIAFDLPDWLGGGHVTVFDGFMLDRFGTLFALSGVFLLLVVINGLFKFYINTYKGQLGERMLRRMRFELIDRVLRFPHAHFKRVKSSEIASMVKDEVEPMGGFIGDAFVAPAFLCGQALTAMVFILAQNMWLGLIAAGIVVLQVFIIPRLRRRLIVLGKQRQLTARELAGRIGEIVDGIAAVHVNDTSNYERADVSARLGRIFDIRYEIYQRKFAVKFLNNFLAQLTPFLFYAVGGYFALQGRLDIGQLVAVISAYKDLPGPIKELIDWDQQRLDVEVKFTQVIEQFSVDDMLAPEQQAPLPEPAAPLAVPLRVSQLSVSDDAGTHLLERVTLDFYPGERVALVGSANSGGEVLAEVLVRLQRPGGGRVSLGDTPLDEFPEGVTGQRFAYAGPDGFLRQGSLRAALLYVLKHAPLRPAQDTSAEAVEARERMRAESLQTGNSPLDLQADWIDYAAAGIDGPGQLLGRIRQVLGVVDLLDDLLKLGLRGVLDPRRAPELAERVLELRREFHRRLEASGRAGLVEMFDPERYCRQATLAENLLFGEPVGDREFNLDTLSSNPYLRAVLAADGLDAALFEMGRAIAATSIELFKDLPPEHPFFARLSFMGAEEIPEFQALLARVQGQAYAAATEADRRLLIRLTFAYIEPRHRLGLLDEPIMERIVAARERLRRGLPAEYRDNIAFYEPDRYNVAASLQDNILLGRVSHSVPDATAKAQEMIRTLLEEFGVEDAVFDLGLDFDVGTGGKRLSAVQRQKLGVARALLKRPDFAIFNRPLSALDVNEQKAIVERVLQQAAGADGHPFAVIWVVGSAQLGTLFDRVVVFEAGTVVEQGAPAELLQAQGTFARLAA